MSTARQLLIFFGVAFGFTWAVEAFMILAHLRIEWIILATFGPTLGALTSYRLSHGDFRGLAIYGSWWRTFAAAVIGALLTVCGYAVIPALALTDDPQSIPWTVLLSPAVFHWSTPLGGPLFEEPGWRGFALPRLQQTLQPVMAALLLGLIWSAWHLPMFFYPGWTGLSPGEYCLFLTAFSVVMSWVGNVSRFAILAPIVVHAIFNTCSKYLGLLLAGHEPQGALPEAWTIILSGWVVALALILITRGHLGRKSSSQ